MTRARHLFAALHAVPGHHVHLLCLERVKRGNQTLAWCVLTCGRVLYRRRCDKQGFDKRGFVWYTNFESRKSQEMSHNPYGALSFWWSEVQRAVRIEGVVCKVRRVQECTVCREVLCSCVVFFSCLDRIASTGCEVELGVVWRMCARRLALLALLLLRAAYRNPRARLACI